MCQMILLASTDSLPAINPDYEITVREAVSYTDYGFGTIKDIPDSV